MREREREKEKEKTKKRFIGQEGRRDSAGRIRIRDTRITGTSETPERRKYGLIRVISRAVFPSGGQLRSFTRKLAFLGRLQSSRAPGIRQSSRLICVKRNCGVPRVQWDTAVGTQGVPRPLREISGD